MAAMRTPPWPLIASGIRNEAVARAFLDRWLGEDPELAGVTAELLTARALSDAWMTTTGGTAERIQQDALHSVTEVIDPPRPACGRLRVATDADRELVLEWAAGFGTATATALSPGKAALTLAAERALAAGGQYIWEDGQPVSGLSHSYQVAGAYRISGVYTPPEFRNRGYASTAVAALSRRLLDQGAERCVLSTDLSNPTSNKIYAQVGYVQVADFERYRLLR